MELWRDGNLVQLTSQEFKVLKFMIQNAERVLIARGVAESCLGIPELSEHPHRG
jgi:DNA-binding response OmpR family regulator